VLSWKCYTEITQKVFEYRAKRGICRGFCTNEVLCKIFWMVLSITPSTHELQKNVTYTQYKSTYESNISGLEGLYSSNTPLTHNTKMSRCPPPPNPQRRLNPRSPWNHQPWTRNAAPWLPMSLQASGAWGWARQLLFLCFWRRNCTHQKLERGAAHRP
jgi:hypothetical protein